MVYPYQFYVIAFVFGAVVGSFLNVCIYRLPKGESVVFPPSHCPGCDSRIAWYDNVPVVSYLLLRGRCRSCRASISRANSSIHCSPSGVNGTKTG